MILTLIDENEAEVKGRISARRKFYSFILVFLAFTITNRLEFYLQDHHIITFYCLKALFILYILIL